MTAAYGALAAAIAPAPSSAVAYVVIVRGTDRALRRFTIRDVSEVGRTDRSSVGYLRIDEPSVSRRHARFEVSGGRLTITDLGSMNGTHVNGRPIAVPTALAVGDTVEFGAVQLVILAAETGGQPAAPTLPIPQPSATPPVAPRARGRARSVPSATVDEREPRRPFPNYLQLSTHVPRWLWHAVRAASITALVALCVVLVARPPLGLHLMWRVVAPLLPLLFLIAPGLWRNICPLAAANQLPRLGRFGRVATPPAWLKRSGYLVAVTLFVAIVPTRRVLFDHSGAASAALLAGALVAAFTGGVLYHGKSGWCSSICPLFPVQRLYGQTPFVTVPNSHCRPCVGCAKNCYDFNPRAAYQADMYDDDPRWSASRKLFAGGFPGVALGYWTLGDLAPQRLYVVFAAGVLASAGSFFALTALTRIRPARLAAVYGALALSVFYWFAAPGLDDVLHNLGGQRAGLLVWPIRGGVCLLAAVWVWRTFRVERTFRRQVTQVEPVRVSTVHTGALLSTSGSGIARGFEVTFQPQGRRVLARAGTSLLEVAEESGLPIEAGCRMGVCGADPVTVLAGAETLSRCGEDEAATLRRLGLTAGIRMACCARVGGAVTVSLDPRAAPPAASRSGGGAPRRGTDRRPVDRSVRRVVVLGNGIAGVTAATEIRAHHPDCELHIVGRESHPLYNRMGISRMVYGRSAMAGLYLLGDDWYDANAITCWLNTQATGIDLAGRQVVLGTGDRLDFDRLILATGARAMVPGTDGMSLAGCFVMREADDALAIRRYAQEHQVRQAVVIGAGPLGLESAYALHQLGLAVSILARGERLLEQYLDVRCAELVRDYLTARGIAVVTGAAVAAILGTDRVNAVGLTNGDRLRAELVVVCTGLSSNVELAAAAGIAVGRGVLVDAAMRTSATDVFAAGDVAELDGRVAGLWPVAVAQATAAARNALGENEPTSAMPVPMMVKGIGIYLASAGQLAAGPGDEVVVRDDPAGHQYGRLLVSGRRLVGAVLLGVAAEAARILDAVRARAPVTNPASLRAGDWTQL